MYTDSKWQMSESFLIGVLLAIVGGFLDAYTYVARGGVFANAQTGNIVLVGIHLAAGEWQRAGAYFLPILAFVCGIFVEEWIKKIVLPLPGIHWRQIVLLFEAAVLFVVALLPLGGTYDLLTSILVSFVCSMQVQSFRKVHGLPYATTMCTGNLRSGTDHLFRFVEQHKREDLQKSLHYYGVILFFILGAGIGVFATQHYANYSANFCGILLLVVCGLLSIKNRSA